MSQKSLKLLISTWTSLTGGEGRGSGLFHHLSSPFNEIAHQHKQNQFYVDAWDRERKIEVHLYDVEGDCGCRSGIHWTPVLLSGVNTPVSFAT